MPSSSSNSSTAPVNRSASTPAVPFDIRVVEINDRVDECNSSAAAASSNASDVLNESDEESVYVLNESDEESVYELVPPTPKGEQPGMVRAGRRSVVTAEEEDEEKEDEVPRSHEIV
ncbi:unnamed protein product [Phytophthora fragariaefolia]|uniref:Unnamed protein product n=1 Tax=Phytophthora fragariaefolia TaxID=1490495 RepID=A0A9W6X426_9STRA|nr:unnamed protein product [Phytophthora fragariaefolia]